MTRFASYLRSLLVQRRSVRAIRAYRNRKPTPLTPAQLFYILSKLPVAAR